MFQVPVPQKVFEKTLVPASNVRVNDTVALENSDVVVKAVTAGPKWVTANDDDGKTLFRVLRDNLVYVIRETEDSRKARYAAENRNYENEWLREGLSTYVPQKNQREVVNTITERLADPDRAGDAVDYSHVTRLVGAVATDMIYRRFFNAVQHQLDKNPELDLVDFVSEYKQHLKDTAFRYIRVLNRSTNVVSNIMDDTVLEATSRFIDYGPERCYF